MALVGSFPSALTNAMVAVLASSPRRRYLSSSSRRREDSTRVATQQGREKRAESEDDGGIAGIRIDEAQSRPRPHDHGQEK